MRAADRMRERHAELLRRIEEKRPNDNQHDLKNLLNELEAEIKKLSATDWDISSRIYVVGTVIEVTISECENDHHDGFRKEIGKINQEQTASEIIVMHNEGISALKMAMLELKDASFRLHAHDYDDTILDIESILNRLALSS